MNRLSDAELDLIGPAHFDIDGVLANDKHRVGHALQKRWAEYFDPERLIQDGVWEEGRETLRAVLATGRPVVYNTGRREDLRDVTSRWLLKNGFPAGLLFMRPANVRTPLPILKADLMERLQGVAGARSLVLYDDDPEVIKQVRARLGEESAIHCTWSVKEDALIKRAQT